MRVSRAAIAAAGLASLAGLILAGTGPARSQGHQTGRLRARPVAEAPPLVDGRADDPVWSVAEPLQVQASGMGAGGGTGPGQNLTTIELSAVYTPETLYLLARWDDATPSIDKNAWRFDGSRWSQSGNEDRLAFLWEIDGAELDGFDQLGCAAACHGGDRMRAPGPGQRVDQWQWKAARSNPMRHADDQYIDDGYDEADDEAAHHGDGGDSSYQDNEADGMPRWAWSSDDPSTPPGVPAEWARRFLLRDEAVDFGADNPLTGAPWAAGDGLPGYALRPPTGSRGDITAQATWAEGRWTLELSRSLDTGENALRDGAPVDAIFELGRSQRFGIAVWDDAGGSAHRHAPGPYELVFETAGEPTAGHTPPPVEPSATPAPQPAGLVWLPLLLRGVEAADSGAPPLGCPIGPEARTLLEEIAYEAAIDAAWTIDFVGPRERGFSLSLPGVDERHTGAATLVESCTTAMTFDAYCDEGGTDEPGDFWQGRSKCLRLGCLAADLGFADVYLTEQPHEDPDERHPFGYASQAPSGAMRYDENPRLRWTYDLRVPEAFVITGTIAQALSFTAPGGSAIDLSHRGVVTATQVGGSPSQLGLDLRFPRLADQPIGLSLHMDEGHLDAGRVRYGRRAIAVIEGLFSPSQPPDFRWEAACTGG